MNLSKEKLLFHHYYANWLRIYKEGAIREVTLKKYRMTLQWLIRLAPSLLLEDLNRVRYQELINSYAKTHERQTTMDFHHQLKGAIFYHLSSSSRYLTKNILCLVIQIRKLFSFGLKLRVKKSTRNEHLMLKIFDKVLQ
ncbi:hypothetical protein APQ97_02425 [Streptococcus suis]|nr:hypothetical protein [Streptococcus suis]UYF64510.1 hypothetical protein MUN40_02695 [Streptococcus suis 89-1591]AML45968.1 hypothetical protein APQ97_02425 [Streptococcus suis]KPA56943.1 hypothetical protein XK23_07090 [Streptococcus suis]MCG9918404.1 hypothetical protein [Streptococcus suis]UYZ65895.1 hypothetical protein NOV96_08615 [Streptococcus suis]